MEEEVMHIREHNTEDELSTESESEIIAGWDVQYSGPDGAEIATFTFGNSQKRAEEYAAWIDPYRIWCSMENNEPSSGETAFFMRMGDGRSYLGDYIGEVEDVHYYMENETGERFNATHWSAIDYPPVLNAKQAKKPQSGR